MNNRRHRTVTLVVLTLICALWATTATATPINYIFAGQRITLGDVLFADGVTTGQLDLAPFTVTLSGDTANVNTSIAGIAFNAGLTGSININATGLFDDNGDPMGIYTATFENPMAVFYNSTYDALGFSMFDGADYITQMEWYGLGFFDLLSPLPLILTERSTATFAMDFTAGPFSTLTIDEVAPVPEPSTFALIGAGIVGLGLARRMRSRKQG